MNTPVLTFFNNKGGVGKTSLIYHLAWMFASMRKRIAIIDLDPQSNLTAAFLEEDQIFDIWNSKQEGSTVFQCVKPLLGVNDIARPVLQKITADLYLLPGDVALSRFEDTLSTEWPKSLDTNLYRPMRIISAFWQVMQQAADTIQADLILVDIGPNLGAINRSVLLSTDFVVIPLGADLFSLQGLSNLGPTLIEWRDSWERRLDHWHSSLEKKEHPGFLLPLGEMKPIGYLCQQPILRLSKPIMAYDKWVQRIPSVYREDVLKERPVPEMRQENDPYCLAIIRHFRSLVPMGQEHRKPIFNLTPADGAIGSHAGAVQEARKDFKLLAEKIAGKIGMTV
ncbi:MAG: ParA family protein [Spirochaetales bacterium]|jgi:cellulose biosynthesis protein BcsQ|nr:ParA family protein [Spirochaetales bacterium]